MKFVRARCSDIFESKGEIKKVRTGLIKNIIDGYLIKGRVQDFAEVS